jgi:hypothetical protein
MTRDERAALRAQRLKDELDAKKRQLAQVEAQQRAAARAGRAKRRQRVGALADEAGLCVWEDTTLTGLFQALARLQATPDPVAVLESLLSDYPDLGALRAAAAGPFLLASSIESDSSEVSTRGGGRCAAVPEKNGADRRLSPINARD